MYIYSHGVGSLRKILVSWYLKMIEINSSVEEGMEEFRTKAVKSSGFIPLIALIILFLLHTVW